MCLGTNIYGGTSIINKDKSMSKFRVSWGQLTLPFGKDVFRKCNVMLRFYSCQRKRRPGLKNDPLEDVNYFHEKSCL